MTLRPLVIDLFCGAGGLSLGAARAGFTVGGAVDNDPKAMDTHRKNFRKTRHLETNLSSIKGESLISKLELQAVNIVGIIGGPPCQGFSAIGRRTVDDTRNDLFVDFFRIVSEVKPDFFLAENVPGIMRPEHAALRDKAFAQVSKAYEILKPIRVSANEYGAPTKRTRIFFTGYLSDKVASLTRDSFVPATNAETVYVKDAMSGLSSEVHPCWQKEPAGWRISITHGEGYFASRLHGHVPGDVGDPIALRRLKSEGLSSGNLGTMHSKDVEKRYADLKHGERDPISKSQKLDPNGFCPTLRAGTGPEKGSYQAVRPIHPSQPRVITPREAARLQGFPDWFTFSPTKWHSFRQIGNSVSPIVAERLMSAFASALD